MVLSLINNSYEYEMQKLCMLFLPYEKIAVGTPENGEDAAIVSVNPLGAETELKAFLRIGGREYSAESIVASEMLDAKKEFERILAVLLFDCFCKAFDRRPPWGILTGVRPAKLMGRLCADMGEASAVEYFRNKLLVSEAKTDLCLRTHKSEEH